MGIPSKSWDSDAVFSRVQILFGKTNTREPWNPEPGNLTTLEPQNPKTLKPWTPKTRKP